MKHLFTALAVLTFYFTIYAQVTEEWVQRYNGPGNEIDAASAITVDGEGNVYVTGRSEGNNTGYDYATIKYNASGDLIWVARYNGTSNGDDEPRAIAVDNLGNVYVTGENKISSTASFYATIKYSPNGVDLWAQYYNGPANFYGAANDLTIDNDGNVYVTGTVLGPDNMSDFATIKYNADGVEQWVAMFNDFGWEAARKLVVDNSGNVYVTGNRYTPGGSRRYVTVKYNPAGVQQWYRNYQGPAGAFDTPTAIAIDNSGNVYVTGESAGINTGFDYTTVKYNPSGTELWVKRYNNTINGYDRADDIKADQSGHIYVTGLSYNGASYDIATVKYDSDGNQLWVQRYNGPNNRFDHKTSLAIDISGNIYVAGSSSTGNNTEYTTLKYSSDGTLLWDIKYSGAANGENSATAITADHQGNIFVTGRSEGNGGDLDYATIKYSQRVITTLTNNVSAGSQVLEVASVNGFTIGDIIVINPGGSTEEKNTIAGFGSILLQSPLQFDHNSGEVVELLTASSLENNDELIADNYLLLQNYPNPFNPLTSIKYQVSSISQVSLKVYDLLGREVATLVNEEKPAGHYKVSFDASVLTSGIYFYKLQTSTFSETKKMVLIR